MKLKLLNNQNGFSLIEAIISAALLGAAAIYGMQVMHMSSQSKAVANQRAKENSIAFQVSSNLIANSNKYPPVIISGSQLAMYGACFDIEGNLLPNEMGKKDYTVLDKFSSGEPQQAFPGMCNGAIFEVIIWWESTAPKKISFKIFNSNPSSTLKRVKKFHVFP